ncbi:MAG: FHA domain-containing protein [Selenomonadaceae bacterium]|nr:FHA domain-containing protein [Selenomonadaceae bacterium]
MGWLVCVEGKDIGKDFRLHAQFNYVGRNENQDISLSDEYVSREKHLTVSYDMLNHRYFAEKGGSSFVYINNQPLVSITQLKRGDQIRIGNSLLVFIPLEQQDVKWNWKI